MVPWEELLKRLPVACRQMGMGFQHAGFSIVPQRNMNQLGSRFPDIQSGETRGHKADSNGRRNTSYFHS
ncbi:hypothetical protein ACVWWK_007108 [Bradyrhizobium sp. LB9.1b]